MILNTLSVYAMELSFNGIDTDVLVNEAIIGTFVIACILLNILFFKKTTTKGKAVLFNILNLVLHVSLGFIIVLYYAVYSFDLLASPVVFLLWISLLILEIVLFKESMSAYVSFDDAYSKLAELKQLRDNNVMTEEEFQKLRAKYVEFL